jgi:Protein kinase domain/AAA ATPase domain
MECLSDTMLAALVQRELDKPGRARLTEHIDRCVACRRLVAALVRDPSAAQESTRIGVPAIAAACHAEPIGTLDGYDVLGVLGTGGMGVVYEVYDQGRDEVVALKRLPRLSAGGWSRLKAEFRALADVHHPHLVRLYDLVQRVDDGFFTMELVRGVRLDEALAPLPSTDRARIHDLFGQLAAALASVHAEGLVHRDIKPANVLVTADDQVKVVDFGLAIAQDPLDASSDDSIAGTLAYMAPEQLRRRPPTPAADWYAFGGCLHRCLTGVTPYAGLGREGMIDAKLSGQVPRRFHHADSELVDLCRALLQHLPDKRPGQGPILQLFGRTPVAARRAGTFIGRRTERAAMHAALERGDSVLVRGAPGLGKTALVAQILIEARAHDSTTLSLHARCRRNEHVPFNAIDGLADGLAKHLQRTAQDRPQPHQVRALGELFPAIGAIVGLDPSATRGAAPTWVRQRAVDELASLLARIGSKRRLILFIDDAQWADVDSVALLSQLLALEARPWRLIATSRVTERGLASAWAAPRTKLFTVALGPLSDSEVEQMLGPGDRVDREALRAAGGHPLWIQRLLQSPDGPRTLDGLIRAEIDALDGDADRLLTLCSIAGTPLSIEALARAAGLETAEARRLAETLCARSLLRVEPPAEGMRLEPFHDRVQQVAAALPDHDARQRRLELARALAMGDLDRQALFACAGHANASLELAGLADAPLFAEVNLRAARDARSATAHRRALRHARAGLEWLARAARGDEVLEPMARELERIEIEALYFTGDVERARARSSHTIAQRPHHEQAALWAQRIRLELVVAGADAAQDASLMAMRQMGMAIEVPRIGRELARLAIETEWSARRHDGRVIGLETLCPPEPRAKMQVCAAALPVAVFRGDEQLTALLALRCLRLTQQHGLAPESLFGMAGHGGAAAMMRRYGRARRVHDQTLQHARTLEQVPPSAHTAVAGWLSPWAEPFRTTNLRLERLEQALESDNDVYSLVMMRTIRLTSALEGGMPLPYCAELPQSVVREVERAGLHFDELVGFSRLSLATLDRIRNGPQSPAAPAHHNPFATFITHLHEGLVRTHWGEVELAAEALMAAYRRRSAARGQALLSRLNSYLPLVACQVAERGGRPPRGMRRAAIEALVELGQMSRACPENHAYRHALAQAELARWCGAPGFVVRRSYDRAVMTASRVQNLEYEAVARHRRLDHQRRRGGGIDEAEIARVQRALTLWGSPTRALELANELRGMG